MGDQTRHPGRGQAALAARDEALPPLPSRADLQRLTANLPELWHAPTTSQKDRKRLLRTLICDVTLLPETHHDQLRIGIRWQTGAADEVSVARPLPPGPAKRTPPPAVEVIKRLGPTMPNHDLVDHLNAAGLRTGHGRPFDITAVQWVRHAHKIPSPDPYAAGELSVAEAARRLGCSTGVVYYWLKTGQLDARRSPGNRLCIAWNLDTEDACRRRIAQSGHLQPAARRGKPGKTTDRTNNVSALGVPNTMETANTAR